MTLLTVSIPVLSTRTATQLATAALDHAEKLGKFFSISVVDPSGILLAFIRMNGAPPQSVQVSGDKAYTAVGFKMPSDAMGERALNYGVAGGALMAASIDRLIPLMGGVPVSVDGVVVGAIGVSGGSGAEDKQVAEAAIAEVIV
jgi:uncharacterized protein GlcG (DUF336 family)